MKSSAMSEKSKIQILSQDLIRRMLNICDTVPQTERNKIVNDYTDRLTLIVCLLCEHQSWVGRPACKAAPRPAESQNSSHRQKAAQDIARGGY